MQINTPKDLLTELTRLNPFDRFSDGRPRVPDEMLDALKEATTNYVGGFGQFFIGAILGNKRR